MQPHAANRSASRTTSGRVSVALVLVVGLTTFLGLGWTAVVMPSYADNFAIAYPTSQSDDHVVAGYGYACMVCHAPAVGGVHTFNAYGWDIKAEIDGGALPSEAIATVALLDSDGDPAGMSNLDEILAGTQPGWTEGPNNTVFFLDGSTTPGILAPDPIQGDLDLADPWEDLGNALAGASGLASLTGNGNPVPANLVTLSLTHAAPNTLAFMIVGTSRVDAPFKGGVLVPSVAANFGLVADVNGGILLIAPWPNGAPSQFSFYFQYWWVDAGGPQGFAASNAISGTTP